MLPTTVLPENAPHDQLIRTAILGDALAQTFVNGSQVSRDHEVLPLWPNHF